MVCPCCCPCKSNDQMPCGYEFPSFTVSYKYGAYSRDTGQLVQKEGQQTFSPKPSRWLNGVTFCGWDDIGTVQNSDGTQSVAKAFTFPGPFTNCGGGNELLLWNPFLSDSTTQTTGTSLSLNIGRGLPGGVVGTSKSQWLSNDSTVSQQSVSGFDFEDWYWDCNKLVLGSFSRSRVVTLPQFGTFIDSVTVTVSTS
jgi:hypothetical protein